MNQMIKSDQISWHARSISEMLGVLDVDQSKSLSDQVLIERIAAQGENALREEDQRTIAQNGRDSIPDSASRTLETGFVDQGNGDDWQYKNQESHCD